MTPETGNVNYRVYATPDGLADAAQALADANGAPVAILSRDGWWRLCELPNLYELLVDIEHWQTQALVDPMDRA